MEGGLPLQEIALRVLAAMLAGIAIGVERQWHHKTAGLRTNTLVALGACFYVVLSVQLTEQSGDVTRIIGQVVTGIGFLGAGIIFRQGANIHGLTTAATVWCSSAIGSIAGAGFYQETLLATLAVLLVNILLVPIDSWLSRRDEEP